MLVADSGPMSDEIADLRSIHVDQSERCDVDSSVFEVVQVHQTHVLVNTDLPCYHTMAISVIYIVMVLIQEIHAYSMRCYYCRYSYINK